MLQENLVEIGERGMSGGNMEDIKEFLKRGDSLLPDVEGEGEGHRMALRGTSLRI